MPVPRQEFGDFTPAECRAHVLSFFRRVRDPDAVGVEEVTFSTRVVRVGLLLEVGAPAS